MFYTSRGLLNAGPGPTAKDYAPRPRSVTDHQFPAPVSGLRRTFPLAPTGGGSSAGGTGVVEFRDRGVIQHLQLGQELLDPAQAEILRPADRVASHGELSQAGAGQEALIILSPPDDHMITI